MTLKTNWANGEQFNASDMNDLATVADAAYVKPGTGIPASDLASAVQTSLGKADTAVQSVSSTNITDATTTGKALLTTTDASTARTTLGVAYGTTGGTVCEGNDSRLSPSSTSITDSTATGRSLLTATDASTARTTLGVAYGTTSTTVCVGNDSRLSDTRNVANTNTVTVKAANLTIQDGTDTTKQAQFAASGITTATTRTYTLPDASTTLVGTDTTQTLSSKTLTNPTVNNYTEGVVAIGTVSSSSTLSLTNGTVQTATLTASTACTFTMPTAVAGKSFVLMLKQAASTGGGTASFTGVKWGTAGAPTVTSGAGKMDIFSFFSDGTNWYGSATQGYTP